MSSSTSDCLKEIATYFSSKGNDFKNPKNWKRRSKHSDSTHTERIFENIKTNTCVVADAQSTGAITIVELTPGIKQMCKHILENCPADDSISTWFVIGALEEQLHNIPKVSCNGTTEEVNFENIEMLRLHDSFMEICAGGDWQPGSDFTISIRNGRLVCGPGIKSVGSANPPLECDDMLIELYGTNQPKELVNVARQW